MHSVVICIDVPDLEEACAFFSRALGFSRLRDDPPNGVVLSAQNIEIFLLKRVEGSTAVRSSGQRRSYRRHWTPIHLDILVDDLPAALAQALAAGAKQEGDIGEGGTIAYCSDPYGNGFCLIQG